MYHIIINPSAQSGRGMQHWKNVKRIFDEEKASYKVHFTKKAGDIAQYAKDLYEASASAGESLHIILMGGDGSVNELLQGFPSLDNLTLSVVPIGSSNDFARSLGISFNPQMAIEHILTKPTTLYTDIGIVHCEDSTHPEKAIRDRRFLVSSGAGYDASICQEALDSPIKRFLNRLGLGKLTYLFVSLKQLASLKPVAADLTLGGSDKIIHMDKMLFVAGMNTRYEGGGFMFAPKASHYDGQVDICAVSGISKGTVLRALPTATKGNHFKFEGIDFYRTTSYTLRTSVPVWVHTDGEVETRADFISVRIMKEAIKLIY